MPNKIVNITIIAIIIAISFPTRDIVFSCTIALRKKHQFKEKKYVSASFDGIYST